MAAPETTATSPYIIHTIIPPGTVPSLDAALDSYAVRLGTPGTPADPGDPLAVPPVPPTAAVPGVPATLIAEDEYGVVLRVIHEEQGYARTTLLKGLFDLLAPDMTPVPPNPEPQPPPADGTEVVPVAASAPTFA